MPFATPANRETVRKTRIGRLPRRIRRSLIISGEGIGPCAVLQKGSEEVAESLQRAADAEACADDTNDPKGKAEYLRIAESWRTLARGYEFQRALGRFILFNESRKKRFLSFPLRTVKGHHSTDENPRSSLRGFFVAPFYNFLRASAYALARASS